MYLNQGSWVIYLNNNADYKCIGQVISLENNEAWVKWSGNNFEEQYLIDELSLISYQGENLTGKKLKEGIINRLFYYKGEIILEVQLKQAIAHYPLTELPNLILTEISYKIPSYYTEITYLTPEEITVTDELQSRVKVRDSVVNEYSDLLLKGVEFPPLTVFYDQINYYLVDGFHRYYAATKLKIDKLPIITYYGNFRNAKLFSLGANSKHGLQRTNADKRKAVQILLNDPEWNKLSLREMAAIASVSHSFIAKILANKKYVKTEVVKDESTKKPNIKPQEQPQIKKIDRQQDSYILTVNKVFIEKIITVFNDNQEMINLLNQVN